MLVHRVRRIEKHWLAWCCCSPGALMCHPTALASLTVLILNDHLLKHLAPGLVTGKLSDVAGLIYFPLLLVAALELVRPTAIRRRDLIAATWCLVTALAFGLVKTVPAATEVFNHTLGWAQWAVGGGAILGSGYVPARAIIDPSDLIALPAVAIAFRIAGTEPPKAAGMPRRLSAAPLAVLMLAALASIATSPAMRSSSTSYEEVLTLSAAAPAAIRHLSVEITNRDEKLNELDLLAGGYSTDPREGSRDDTKGLIVSLVPDGDTEGQVGPTTNYSGTGLDLFEICSISCETGATVIARLTDPTAVGSREITTNIVVDLIAGTSEEGTGPADIDLGLRNDEDRAFQGMPGQISARRSGRVHIGADQPELGTEFEIIIDAAALQEPYGYPLVGEIAVWHDNKTAIGHPNDHSTAFEFDSPGRPPDRYEYWWVDVGTGWLDEPDQPPTSVDLLPLCEPEKECRIHATLTSIYDPYYEAYLDNPDEPSLPPERGSIDFDWHVEVRLLAFDGRELPEGGISFSGLD